MNRTVFEEYKKYSTEGGVWNQPGSFACAFRNAKNHIEPTKPELEFKMSRNGGHEATVKVEGFDVVVELAPSPDFSFAMDGVGEFTDKPPARRWGSGRHSGIEVGVIDRFHGKEDRRRNEYRYFVPATSYAEHFNALRKMNYGKAKADFLARQSVKQDYKLAEKLAEGQLGEWDILVRVYKKGIQLANGCLGMGVIDNLRTESQYVNDTAWDCIGETVDEAKKTLAELLSDDEEPSEEN